MKTLGSNGVIKFLIPILSFPQLHFWTTYDAVKKLLNLHTQTEASVTVFRLIHAFIQILILTRYMKRQQIDALMDQTAFFVRSLASLTSFRTQQTMSLLLQKSCQPILGLIFKTSISQSSHLVKRKGKLLCTKGFFFSTFIQVIKILFMFEHKRAHTPPYHIYIISKVFRTV